MNGKLVNAKVTLKNGSAFVDASFIRQYIDNGYNVKGSVELRSAAETGGATVEALTAAGETRAAILIYTKE